MLDIQPASRALRSGDDSPQPAPQAVSTPHFEEPASRRARRRLLVLYKYSSEPDGGLISLLFIQYSTVQVLTVSRSTVQLSSVSEELYPYVPGWNYKYCLDERL